MSPLETTTTLGRYSAAILRGTGTIDDTLALLDVWTPTMPLDALAALAPTVLGKATAQRARDLAYVFARRYLRGDPPPAHVLQRVRAAGAPAVDVRALLLVYTARAEPIVRDYVAEVYWPRYASGAPTLPRAEADAFLAQALARGDISAPWSESTQLHVAQNLNAILADFGWLSASPPTNRRFQPVALSPLVAGVIAYEHHAAGRSDHSLPDAPDWTLFGLDRYAVVGHLERLMRGGHLVVQHAGDLLRLSWRYTTLDEAILALTD